LTGGNVLRQWGDRLPPAARTGTAEARVFGHGIGDLREIEDLMSLQGLVSMTNALPQGQPVSGKCRKT
jgi:hypothetical protein